MRLTARQLRRIVKEEIQDLTERGRGGGLWLRGDDTILDENRPEIRYVTHKDEDYGVGVVTVDRQATVTDVHVHWPVMKRSLKHRKSVLNDSTSAAFNAQAKEIKAVKDVQEEVE